MTYCVHQEGTSGSLDLFYTWLSKQGAVHVKWLYNHADKCRDHRAARRSNEFTSRVAKRSRDVTHLCFDVRCHHFSPRYQRSFVRSLSISATFETLSGNMCYIFVHSAQCSIFVRFLLIKNISLLQFIDRISALCCECKCWKVNVDSQLSNSVGLHSAKLPNRFSCRVVCTSRPRNVV